VCKGGKHGGCLPPRKKDSRREPSDSAKTVGGHQGEGWGATSGRDAGGLRASVAGGVGKKKKSRKKHRRGGKERGKNDGNEDLKTPPATSLGNKKELGDLVRWRPNGKVSKGSAERGERTEYLGEYCESQNDLDGRRTRHQKKRLKTKKAGKFARWPESGEGRCPSYFDTGGGGFLKGTLELQAWTRGVFRPGHQGRKRGLSRWFESLVPTPQKQCDPTTIKKRRRDVHLPKGGVPDVSE